MGYIKLDRKMLEWEWYKDVNTKTVFLHCLLRANWKDGSFLGVKIPRGSFATSVNNLAEEVGLTVRQTRTALDKLKVTNSLSIKRHSKFSMITVIEYDKYQSDDKQNVNQMTVERQTECQSDDSRATTIEEVKNINNKKNKKIYIGAYQISDNEVLQSAFNDFLEMRNAIKKPMTERAITNMIAKLKKLSPDEYVQADILDQSINNSWQDVYPLKNGFISTRQKPKKPEIEEEPEMTDEEFFAMVDNNFGEG